MTSSCPAGDRFGYGSAFDPSVAASEKTGSAGLAGSTPRSSRMLEWGLAWALMASRSSVPLDTPVGALTVGTLGPARGPLRLALRVPPALTGSPLALIVGSSCSCGWRDSPSRGCHPYGPSRPNGTRPKLGASGHRRNSCVGVRVVCGPRRVSRGPRLHLILRLLTLYCLRFRQRLPRVFDPDAVLRSWPPRAARETPSAAGGPAGRAGRRGHIDAFWWCRLDAAAREPRTSRGPDDAFSRALARSPLCDRPADGPAPVEAGSGRTTTTRTDEAGPGANERRDGESGRWSSHPPHQAVLAALSSGAPVA